MLEGETSVEDMKALLKQLEPKDRFDALMKILNYFYPRLRAVAVEAQIDQSEQEKSRIDLGRLTREQRQTWYELYRLACGSNGQNDEGEQVKTQDH